MGLPSQKCSKSNSETSPSMFSASILTHSFFEALERYGHLIFLHDCFSVEQFFCFSRIQHVFWKTYSKYCYVRIRI